MEIKSRLAPDDGPSTALLKYMEAFFWQAKTRWNFVIFFFYSERSSHSVNPFISGVLGQILGSHLDFTLQQRLDVRTPNCHCVTTKHPAFAQFPHDFDAPKEWMGVRDLVREPGHVTKKPTVRIVIFSCVFLVKL